MVECEKNPNDDIFIQFKVLEQNKDEREIIVFEVLFKARICASYRSKFEIKV